MDEQPQFEFTMRYVDRPIDGYYHTNWTNSVIATVVAPTRAEAFTTLWAMLGDAGQHRTWTARVLSAKQVGV